jgi:hypothetical protein
VRHKNHRVTLRLGVHGQLHPGQLAVTSRSPAGDGISIPSCGTGTVTRRIHNQRTQSPLRQLTLGPQLQ